MNPFGICDRNFKTELAGQMCVTEMQPLSTWNGNKVHSATIFIQKVDVSLEGLAEAHRKLLFHFHIQTQTANKF